MPQIVSTAYGINVLPLPSNSIRAVESSFIHYLPIKRYHAIIKDSAIDYIKRKSLKKLPIFNRQYYNENMQTVRGVIMGYSDAIQKINEKYHKIILKKYGLYLSGPYCRTDLATDIKVLSEQDCVGENEDLKNKRGKCVYATGEIVLRETAFIQGDKINEHLLIHEYIHRLACNQKRFKFRFERGSGFDFTSQNVSWTIINELMTEWLAIRITDYREDTPYQRVIGVIEDLREYLGKDRFELLIEAYFRSDLGERDKWFYYRYGHNYQEKIFELNKRIMERYSLQL